MSKKYTSKQFWELYEKLPQELKDALFAEETGHNIYETCKRNEIEENLSEIVDYVGQVLVGVLLPEEFQEVLEKELKLKKAVAKKIAHEINRFIFYPVKPALEKLYQLEIDQSIKSDEEAIEETKIEKEEPKVPLKTDTYRETIE